MQFLSDKKIILFYFLAIIILAGSIAYYYYNSDRVKHSYVMVQHTQDVINKSNEVLLDILNIETGTRGFLLTNNVNYIDQFRHLPNVITNNLLELKKLTIDNPLQQARINSLTKTSDRRIKLAYVIIKDWPGKELTPMQKYYFLNNSRLLTDSVKTLISEINKAEFQTLKQRKINNEKTNNQSELMLFVLILMIFSIFILVVIIIKNNRQRNIELETNTQIQKELYSYSRSLLEASQDPIVAINAQGKITDVNSAKIKITGISRENLIGNNFFDYFTEPDKAEEFYKQVFSCGSVTNFPLTILNVNGDFINVLFNGAIYKDSKDNLIGAVVYGRDITEQKWATDLRAANIELAYQNDEKEKRAHELSIANIELAYQNDEKEKRAQELSAANIELAFQNDEKEKRAAELGIANVELAFQNDEKEKRAHELSIANVELAYQNDEKEKRAQELSAANIELAFQNDEKEKRAAELILANKELLYQTSEKEKRADELKIADKELEFQNEEKEKRVTENKELEALSDSLKLASQYARSLIDASLDPLFTINPLGKIMDVNIATVNITGVARENLIGTDFINYFTEPTKAIEGYKQVFENGFVVDYPLTIKDGELTDVLFNGSVYKNQKGSVLGAVVVARDITERNRIENQLNEAIVFAEMATEIAEIAKAKAETSMLTAENAVKAKQQFLSNMSHEIRTPMNAIVGFTKVLLKTNISTKQNEYLNAIKLSGDALIVLINDILDLAKVDAGKMVFEQMPFKLAASISAMLHLFETKILEKNLELIKEYDKRIPAVLVGDSVRLNQIILNLVSNAVKFTSKGKITVSITLLSEDHDKVNIEFSVKDTGIGISESKLLSVFDNFQQASSDTARLYGGTGLGLAIVKQLVESQGGSIKVESHLNVGSNFNFVLSFFKTTEDAETEVEFEEPDNDLSDIKVLVVEDMALNQLLMKTLLDDFGFELEIAANGLIAIEKLKSQAFDIILMDLQMPVMNGFEATVYIRKELKLDIPIIALTADVTTVDLAKCRAVGMNDYIPKPIDERLLYNKITGLIKRPFLEEIIIKETLKTENKTVRNIEPQFINLEYLNIRTKSNPRLMMEMISLYLDQTPALVIAMNKSFLNKDWLGLHAAVHKMIPSFAIMGIKSEYENMARKIQDFATSHTESDHVDDVVLQLADVCTQACHELEIEYNSIKNTNK